MSRDFSFSKPTRQLRRTASRSRAEGVRAAHDEWRAAGYRTIPCRLVAFVDNKGHQKKRPRFPGGSWENAEAYDLDQAIREGYLDIAIVLDNAVQHDFDPRNGETKENVRARMEAAITRHGLGGGICCETGRGFQILLRAPNGKWTRNTSPPELIDEVRCGTEGGHGLLAFVWPSYHPVTRTFYRLLSPRPIPPLIELPECPVALLKPLVDKAQERRRITVVAPCEDGSRGDWRTLDIVALFQAHGLYIKDLGNGKHGVTCPWDSLHSTGGDGTDTVIFEAHATQTGFPGFRCQHAHCEQRTFADVRDYFGAEIDRYCSERFRPEPVRTEAAPYTEDGEAWPEAPRVPGPPEPERIPLEDTPAGFYRTVHTVANGTQTAPEFVAWQALGCISAALRGRYDVRVDDRPWIETGVLDPVPILPTGARKSPPFKLLTRAIARFELDQRDKLAEKRRHALDRVRHLKSELDRAIKRAGDSHEVENKIKNARSALTQAETAVPVLPRIRVGDTTSEALALLMRDQGGAIALLAPEGDPLKVLAGRYDEGHHARLELLKQGYDREPYIRDRVKEREDPIYIPDPILTIGLSMQPGVIDALQNRDVFRYEGVLARIFWCIPPHRLGQRKTGTDVPRIDMEVLADYSTAIRRLLELPMPDEPIVLDLTDEARDLIYEYEAWIEERIGDDGELAPIRDWMAKAAGKAVRLALVFEQYARAADPATTTESFSKPVGTYIDAALAICRAATSHAFHVLVGMDMDVGMRDQRYVFSRAIGLPEGSTLRDLYHACDQRTGLGTMDDLRPIVRKLVDRGCLRLRERPSRGGQPPSPVVEIHPVLRDLEGHKGQKARKNVQSGTSGPSGPVGRGEQKSDADVPGSGVDIQEEEL